MPNIHIVERANIIKVATEQIRDNFPDDLPYLWEKLEPFIITIEECANAIKRESR